MTTKQVGTLEEIIQFTPTEELELLAALVADGTIWELQGFYGRLGAAALEAGFITPEGRVTEEGYALAASYEEQPTAEKDQRLIVGGADEPVPGPFATPNVNA
jgi:hypothetical protein